MSSGCDNYEGTVGSFRIVRKRCERQIEYSHDPSRFGSEFRQQYFGSHIICFSDILGVNMSGFNLSILRNVVLLIIFAVVTTMAQGQSRNLAPGFSKLEPNAKVLLMPSDIELYTISAGGVAEPKADWTQDARNHFRAALLARKKSLGTAVIELSEQQVDEHAEINSLHAAVASAIAIHHFGPSVLRLPTKDNNLDWSLGDPVRTIREKTGADYALFTWIRDSYASSERIAATVLLALVGIGIAPGGLQQGYASLVDLNNGRIVWFSRLFRGHGDLREAEKAAQTLDALLTEFPSVK